MIGAAVLPIQIVGMLPHVHHRQRRHARADDRRLGVRGADDGELAALGDQPGKIMTGAPTALSVTSVMNKVNRLSKTAFNSV